MPKKKPEHEKAKKLSISIPRDVWNLAEVQMFNRRQGESEYIRELIKADTQQLWLQKHQKSPMLLAAEDPTPYGNPAANATVPLARRSSTSYTPRKAK